LSCGKASGEVAASDDVEDVAAQQVCRALLSAYRFLLSVY